MADQRFPRKLFSVGEDPDPRFTLANERTFLAWIRTALALIAGGVALEVFGLGLHSGFRLSASFLLLTAGVLAPVQAWFGWLGTERALRHQRSLPSSITGFIIAVLICTAGVCVIIGIVVG
ncbi:YidH family protein [Arthrobacter sp. MDT2-2]